MLKEKKISIVAPSSAPKNNQWKKSFQILKSWGLKVDFPANSLNPNFFHSNSDSKRAFFLKKAFTKKSSSVVWMLRGGYGCQKLHSVFPEFNSSSGALEKSLGKKLQKNLGSRKPETKLFIGYSDGTALHLYLNSKNKNSLHAPTLSELNELSSKELNTLKSVLLGEKTKLCFKNLKVFHPLKFSSLDSFKKGSSVIEDFKQLSPRSSIKVSSALKKTASVNMLKEYKNINTQSQQTLRGKITGGNLSLLSTSVGAFKFPSKEFLFLEDVNEPAYKVDRLLHHLLYSGVLKSTKALLFGDFYPLKKREFQEVLKSFSQSCSLPLVWGLPCGHSQRMPLPFNTSAELSFHSDKAVLTVSTTK